MEEGDRERGRENYIITGPCSHSPCLNGGQCSTNGDQFTCSCATGYTGTVCEDIITGPCSHSPCLNGGQCSTNGDQFTCSCATGYTGTVCEDGGSGNGGGGQSDGLSTTATIIIAAIVAVFVVVIIIVVLVVCLKRRRRNKEESRAPSETRDNTYEQRVIYRNDRSQGNGTPDLKRQKQPTGQKGQRGHQRHGTVYDKAERKIGDEFPRQKLTLHEHLGSGAFANVVRAEAMGVVKRGVSTIAAVKMLKDTATESDRSDFMKELKVYRMLEPHPNIIVMLGCCTDEEPYYLIMEYASHGNLQSHLRAIRNAPESPYNNIEGQRREFLTPNEILEFGSQIANGMKYLSSKQCIHRDLATRNVLLGDGLVCKLSDFGLARDISEQNSYEMQSRGRVPVRWMAIESLLENSYTSKSDVWSFGVTMWELVTVGSHPYPGMSSKKVIDELRKGYRLPKPEHCSQDIFSLMQECWQERPEKRPSFGQIYRKFDQMLEDANGYLTMTDFNASSYVYLDPNVANSDSSVENDEHAASGRV
ncbi:tyrosine kinase receptor Cad96Ca-like [Amphiura filiformis]|uniref:tyrosine kinase receptor Cad96Ca-like n=1 Tax=Amphiura filiformis TaxID=82378 RepID=UPI003B223324